MAYATEEQTRSKKEGKCLLLILFGILILGACFWFYNKESQSTIDNQSSSIQRKRNYTYYSFAADNNTDSDEATPSALTSFPIPTTVRNVEDLSQYDSFYADSESTDSESDEATPSALLTSLQKTPEEEDEEAKSSEIEDEIKPPSFSDAWLKFSFWIHKLKIIQEGFEIKSTESDSNSSNIILRLNSSEWLVHSLQVYARLKKSEIKEKYIETVSEAIDEVFASEEDVELEENSEVLDENEGNKNSDDDYYVVENGVDENGDENGGDDNGDENDGDEVVDEGNNQSVNDDNEPIDNPGSEVVEVFSTTGIFISAKETIETKFNADERCREMGMRLMMVSTKEDIELLKTVVPELQYELSEFFWVECIGCGYGIKNCYALKNFDIYEDGNNQLVLELIYCKTKLRFICHK